MSNVFGKFLFGLMNYLACIRIRDFFIIVTGVTQNE